jgi:hypothetical protein
MGGCNRFTTTSISQRCVDSQSQGVLNNRTLRGCRYSRLHDGLEGKFMNTCGNIGFVLFLDGLLTFLAFCAKIIMRNSMLRNYIF